MRYIIAEGPDGSGKSTLLQEISNITGKEVIHSGGPIKSQSEYYERIELIESLLPNYLIDRSVHVSEAVYSILRGGLQISWSEYIEVLSKLKKLNPLIIYCRLKDSEEMMSLMKTEGKEYKSNEHTQNVRNEYMKIIERYDYIIEFLESMDFDVIHFNWKEDSFEDLINCILQ